MQGKDIVSDKFESTYKGCYDNGTRPNLQEVSEILQDEVK